LWKGLVNQNEIEVARIEATIRKEARMTGTLFKSAVCRSLDGPDAVVLQEGTIEPLGPGQCQIRMKAAALNFPDLLMTYGKYQFKPEVPFILGMEGAGVVDAVSDDVVKFKVGEAVMVKNKTGAFATHFIANTGQLEKMPRSLTFEEGAAFAVTYSTAYVSLVERGKLLAGETLVVLGAGGGVGQASVEVGKALGATVIAAASSPEKLEIAKRCGADHLIDYSQQSFPAIINEITGGKGANVILDPVGGAFFEQSLDCVAWEGRILVVGFASGQFGVLKTNLAMEKGCSIIGVRAGEFGRQDPEAGRRSFSNLINLTEDRKLKPLIGKRWPLDQIREALKAMERRDVTGKQVIVIEN
jgi:NADPH2:quinone reductase